MKKLLFALLAVALLVGAFGVTASAATEDFTTKTMNNFTATSTTTVDGNKCQYYFDGDLHLVLTGTNTLSLSSGYGIYVEGHLTISGTGTLNISNATTGIYVGKDLTIESGTITAPSIKVQGGSYIMNGGTVTVTGNVDASNKDFTMNGGTLIAANAYAKTATIADSTLSLTGDLDAYSTIEIINSTVDANCLNTDYSDITIQSGTVTASYVTPYGNLYIYDGTVTTYSISYSSWNSDVYIYGGTVVTDRISSDDDICVYGGSLTVSEYFDCDYFYMYGGTVYVEPRLSSYYTIYVYGGNLTAKNGLSNSYSSSSYYGIDICGGTVNVESSEYSGIYAGGYVSITGGTVTIESNSYGISAGGNISLTAGTVSIYGGEQALRATSTITWSDKSCVTYYTGKNNTDAKVATQYYSEKYVKTTEQHTWNSGYVDESATHFKEGTYEYACTVCSATKTEPIPKLEAHVFSSYDYIDENTHIKKCNCGATEVAVHSWSGGKLTAAATHLSEGARTYICSGCSATREEVVPRIEAHNFTTWTAVDQDTHTRKCECGEVETMAHEWNNGKITTPATHLAAGTIEYTCTGYSHKKTERIPELEGHTFDSWTFANDTTHTRKCECGKVETASHNWSEATCLHKKTCTDCQAEAGEVNPENHEQEIGSYIKTEDGNHQQKWNCCDAVAVKEKHSDKDKDHDCDKCNASMGKHEAPEGSHVCEYCEETVSKCRYNSEDICKICGKSKGSQSAPVKDEQDAPNPLVIILAFVGGTATGTVIFVFLLAYIKKKKAKS